MFKNDLGFTLIETMIAIATAGILVASIYNLYISQSKAYMTQEQVTDMRQNARVAMEFISRDIRTAGFGQPTWTMINNTSGITYRGAKVTDGGMGNPDILQIVGCVDPPPATLASAASSGDTSITLHSGKGSKFNATTKSDIFIGELENARVISVSGNVLNIDTNPGKSGYQGLVNVYPAGANIHIVKRVAYTIKNTSLRRNENTGSGAQEIAVNIEDFQATLTKPTVNFSITARTGKKDPGHSGDGYHRMTLSSRIIARNLE